MTTQYAVFKGLPTGLTITKKVFTAADPDTEVTGITGANTERTNAKGEYVLTITKSAVITGIHTIILFVGSTPISTGSRTFAGTDGETATTTPETAALDSGLTADIAQIKADSAAAAGYGADLVAKITTNVATALAKLYYMITGTGVDSKFTAKAVEDAPTGGVGSGDWTDGEKSQIRYRLGLDGTATAPAEPDVDPIVITPATGIMTTGYLVTRVKGVATAGIKIYYQHVQEPTADRGSSYDDTIYSATSNSEGIAQLSLVKGGLYYIWRTSATRPKDLAAYRVLNTDGSLPGSTLALPSHVGH